MNYQASRRASRTKAQRLGYTLLEIMTAVTLGLMLMYAVAKIFSRVGGQMNETMSTMEMTNALRNARNRLTADLEALSVTPQAPRNSVMDEGFLYYAEGLGGPFLRVDEHLTAQVNGGNPNALAGFASGDVALDTERRDAYGDLESRADNTAGDLDDVLAFTAKAPAGQFFRGRYIEPIYDATGALADGVISTFEAEYAEIIWFVRGTTLYRRVLPIMRDEDLQESFRALKKASETSGSELSNVAYGNVQKGFGFYYFYDVSVHLGEDGNLVANTLGDLTNRRNRYFYWNSCGLHQGIKKLDANNNVVECTSATPTPIHGALDAWYWLRMPTLQESAAPNFRAGAPFGCNSLTADKQGGDFAKFLYGAPYAHSSELETKYWLGPAQYLTYKTEIENYAAGALPNPNKPGPFIDYWNNPNVWDEVNSETGDLRLYVDDMLHNANNSEKVFNQDVILTNVLSFNVKVWEPTLNAYIDLGSRVRHPSSTEFTVAMNDPNNFGSFGFYAYQNQGNATSGDDSKYRVKGNDVFPWLPAVFDTWTEQYQLELFAYDNVAHPDNKPSSGPLYVYADGSPYDIPSQGPITAAHLKNLPPPYNGRINSLQIELRVFDPRSKHIRNATFNVDLSSK